MDDRNQQVFTDQTTTCGEITNIELEIFVRPPPRGESTFKPRARMAILPILPRALRPTYRMYDEERRRILE